RIRRRSLPASWLGADVKEVPAGAYDARVVRQLNQLVQDPLKELWLPLRKQCKVPLHVPGNALGGYEIDRPEAGFLHKWRYVKRVDNPGRRKDPGHREVHDVLVVPAFDDVERVRSKKREVLI